MLTCLVVLALFGNARHAVGAAPRSNTTAANRIGIATILEGKATLIRGLSQSDAVEGIRLLPGDLIRTQAKSLLRIEYPDECSLEAGPATELQLFHPGEKRRGRPALYLLQGWLKLGCQSGSEAAVSSKDLDVLGISRVVVIRINGDSRAVFAEQGTARVVKHRAGDFGSVSLNPGDFLEVEPDVTAEIQPRPTAAFMEALPRAYRDTLPSRYSIYVSRVAEPQSQRSFVYTDVEQWLNCEPVIRRQFVGWWVHKINDPAFRGPLDRDLAKHPEWDRILHPEKYEVQDPIPPSAVGARREAAVQPALQPALQSTEGTVPKSK